MQQKQLITFLYSPLLPTCFLQCLLHQQKTKNKHKKTTSSGPQNGNMSFPNQQSWVQEFLRGVKSIWTFKQLKDWRYFKATKRKWMWDICRNHTWGMNWTNTWNLIFFHPLIYLLKTAELPKEKENMCYAGAHEDCKQPWWWSNTYQNSPIWATDVSAMGGAKKKSQDSSYSHAI